MIETKIKCYRIFGEIISKRDIIPLQYTISVISQDSLGTCQTATFNLLIFVVI